MLNKLKNTPSAQLCQLDQSLRMNSNLNCQFFYLFAFGTDIDSWVSQLFYTSSPPLSCWIAAKYSKIIRNESHRLGEGWCTPSWSWGMMHTILFVQGSSHSGSWTSIYGGGSPLYTFPHDGTTGWNLQVVSDLTR